MTHRAMENPPNYHVRPELLAVKYNNPPRPALPKAVNECLTQGSPHDLWMELQRLSLIPDSLANDDRRHFGCEAEQTEIWPDSRPPELATPCHVGQMLALASDPWGILATEKSAQELAKRLLPWGAICNERIVWYFTDNPYEVSYLGPSIEFAADSALWTLLDHEIDIDSLLPELNQPCLPKLVQHHLASYEAWFIASDRRFPLTEPPWIDFRAWKSCADLNNPLEPLVELWLRGYRLVSQFTDKDPYIRLYAKPVDPTESHHCCGAAAQ